MNVAQRKKQFNEQNHHRGLYWPNGYTASWRTDQKGKHSQLVCIQCDYESPVWFDDAFIKYCQNERQHCPVCHGKSITDRWYYLPEETLRRSSCPIEQCRVYERSIFGLPWKRRFHNVCRLAKQSLRC